MIDHPALQPGNVALVTGGGAGIGLAAARRFASAGMAVVIVDNRAELLEEAAQSLRAAGALKVVTSVTDVADYMAMRRLADEITTQLGGVDVLMNNAGIQPGSAIFGPIENWRRILDVNLMGIVHGTQLFVPGMIARGRPGLVINTGSKQGITTPPGDPAYNTAKSAVRTFTEALAHELRNSANPAITAHLLIPGFVFTDLTRGARTERPAAAWTPEQTADFMLESLAKGDFYILCPDNDVDRALDEKRMAWAIGDIIENRPPLSRWHPDYAEKFADFVNSESSNRP